MEPKLWYGIIQKEYEGPEPCFFNSNDFPWVKEFESKYPIIMDELAPLIQNDQPLKPYFDNQMQFPPSNWRTIGFSFWSRRNQTNCRHFPITASIFEKIPGYIGATLNLLEPESRIKPHLGDTNAIIRSHFGLVVPAGLPECGFRVKAETRPWEEGKLMMFLDAYEHEAFNMSKGKRFILVIDVIRPEFMDRKINICSRVLAMLSLYRVADKLPFIKKWPLPVLYFMLALIQPLWWVYLPIQQVIDRWRIK